MTEPRTLIQRFFEKYEEGANTFDVDLATSQFARDYLAGGPAGVTVGTNDEELRAAIPQREAFMRGIGFQKAEILDLTETVLDDHYSMVAARWRLTFASKSGNDLAAEFEILYFLYIDKDEPKIVFFISHEDEEAVMRDLRLLPN